MKRPSWLCLLVPYLGRRQAEEDLQEELRLHVELERDRQREAGLSEADALRAARRRLGNGTLIRERTRDVWGWRWLDELGRDVRHALRGLGRSPGFAAVVVLVLALDIGANTAMFSVVHGMLIRTLEERIKDEASKRRCYRELDEAMEGLVRLPDVAAVGVTSRLPLAESGSVQQRVHVLGRPAPDDPRESPVTPLHVVSPLRLLRAGASRDPDRADGSPPLRVDGRVARPFRSRW